MYNHTVMNANPLIKLLIIGEFAPYELCRNVEYHLFENFYGNCNAYYLVFDLFSNIVLEWHFVYTTSVRPFHLKLLYMQALIIIIWSWPFYTVSLFWPVFVDNLGILVFFNLCLVIFFCWHFCSHEPPLTRWQNNIIRCLCCFQSSIIDCRVLLLVFIVDDTTADVLLSYKGLISSVVSHYMMTGIIAFFLF